MIHPHTDGDNSMELKDTSFSIDDVQQVLAEEQTRERVVVPPGEYLCQIKLPLPDVRQDSKGHNKLLLPLEISGGEYDQSWLFEAIYMNNQHDSSGKTKDGISKRQVARLCNAVGIKVMKDFEEIAGKFVYVDYGPNKGGYNEIREVKPFSKPSPASTGTEIKDDIPF